MYAQTYGRAHRRNSDLDSLSAKDIVIPFSLILHFLIHSSASKEGVSFDTLGTNPAKVLSKGICKNEMGNVKNECIPYGPASFSDVNPQV